MAVSRERVATEQTLPNKNTPGRSRPGVSGLVRYFGRSNAPASRGQSRTSRGVRRPPGEGRDLVPRLRPSGRRPLPQQAEGGLRGGVGLRQHRVAACDRICDRVRFAVSSAKSVSRIALSAALSVFVRDAQAS